MGDHMLLHLHSLGYMLLSLVTVRRIEFAVSHVSETDSSAGTTQRRHHHAVLKFFNLLHGTFSYVLNQ